MKRIILFCLLVLSYTANAQLLGGPNAEWWYEKTFLGPPYYYHFWLGQDTVIQGRNCNTILGIEYHTNSLSTPPFSLYLSGAINRGPYYVASSGDTLLYFTNNQFYVQNIFGAPAGTQWECAPTAGVCQNLATVVTNNTIVQNGITLRSSVIKKTNCLGQRITQTMRERIGGMEDLLFPYFWIAVDTFGTSCDKYRLNCYTDTDISVSSVGDCDGTLLGLEIPKAETLSIYPNPASNIINLAGLKNQPYTYALFNSAGQLVKQANNTSNTIDITDNAAGLYFVKISLPNGYSQAFKVVKN